MYLDRNVARSKLEGGPGFNVMDGNYGRDTLIGGNDGNLMDGGEGPDTITGGDAADSIVGSGGDDDIDGGKGSDLVEGGPGRDTLTGGPGDDIIIYRKGDLQDTSIDGGEGIDTLCLEGTISDYTVMFGEQVQDLAANGGLLMVPPGVSLRVFQGSGQPPYKSILAPRGSDPLAAVPTLTSIERVRLTVGVKA
ncbi:hypothetical protein MNEG_10817 [Monoraphidium neglectum]|uniref:Uncharacterized protein n=1 Tax=Monoraphidium neglectum TaxID=145388 RepID=A0A0D2JBR6_9CHLO|nr:hypothetical protein MNEG_10817 [Monoraphidium neglectum]KIY97147.1 hypothetical protein MNEG_10817 [Monoraphidium neglectum]|eukprot:XP_013896167.1 hypothetical protein MNEG_10817 [Monoraphidium neglectum]